MILYVIRRLKRKLHTVNCDVKHVASQEDAFTNSYVYRRSVSRRGRVREGRMSMTELSRAAPWRQEAARRERSAGGGAWGGSRQPPLGFFSLPDSSMIRVLSLMTSSRSRLAFADSCGFTTFVFWKMGLLTKRARAASNADSKDFRPG